MPINGKQIRDFSVLLDKLNPQTGQILTLLGNTKIQQNQLPTAGIDLANKDYVDAVAQGLNGKTSCRTTTTTNISISSAPSSIGGVTLSLGDRILVKDQISGQENGIYEFNGTGNALTRTIDANDNSNPIGVSEIRAGLFTFITEGTLADTGWLLSTNNPIIIDTTPLTFIQFSSAGIITTSNGLTKTGNDITLGGSLTQNTLLTGSYSLTFDASTLQYLNNQHLTYNNRSLVDKEYVDINITGLDNRVIDLETVVFYTNQLISGGASFISGLTFAVTNLLYIINGQVYTSLATNVTINPGDSLYDRIDIIVVDIDGVVSVVEGVPAMNPIKPDIDETTQVEVTFITVPMGAVTLPIPITIVYNENLGQPTEWSATTNYASNINVNSTTGTPYNGTKSIELTNVPTAKTIVFTTPTPFDTTTQNTLQFAIKNKIAWTTTRRLRITLQSASGVQLGNIVDIYQGLYGFSSANTSIWQIITIPISKFSSPSALISKIVITTYSTSGTLNLYLDYVRLIVGSPTTTTQNTFLSVKDDAAAITTATSPTDILSILGGTNITSVVGTKTLTLNLDPNITVTSITSSTFGLSSSIPNTLAYFNATKHLTSVDIGSGLTFSGGTLSTVSNLNGTTNYVAKFTNSTTIGTSSIYDDGTNIGIGTTSSTAKIHIKGIDSTNSNYAFKLDNFISNPLFYVRNDGNIGIGTYSQANTSLHIQGKSAATGNDAIVVNSLILGPIFTVNDYLPRVAIGALNNLQGSSLTLGDNFSTQYYLGFGDNSTKGRIYSSSDGIRTEYLNTSTGDIDVYMSSDSDTYFYMNSYVSASFRYNMHVGHTPDNPYDFNNTIRLYVRGINNNDNTYVLRLDDTNQTNILNISNAGIIRALPTYATYSNSGTASFIGIDDTGKFYNTGINPVSLSSSFWSFNGNTVGSVKYIGTNDNYDFPFYTNGLERMRILSNGYIGIGITISTARLQVIGYDSTSSNYGLKVDNSTLTPLFYVRNDGFVSINQTTIGAAKLEITGGSDQGIYVQASGSIALNTLDNTGFANKAETSSGTAYRANITNILGTALDLNYTPTNTTLFKVFANGNVYTQPTYNDLSSTGTASFLGIDSTGKLFNFGIGTSSITYTFNNGIYEASSVVQLGGPLIQNTVIDLNNYYIDIKAGASQTLPLLRFIDSSNSELFRINSDSRFNIFIGESSGIQNSALSGAIHNYSLGYQTLSSNVSGFRNIAIGSYALSFNLNGTKNVALGYAALYQNQGDNNSAFGDQALFNNLGGTQNMAFGSNSLFLNIIGSYNTAVGVNTLSNNQSGSFNVAIGSQAGQSLNSDDNTMIGVQAGLNTLGSGNVFLGRLAGQNELGSNKLYISNNATTDPLIYGDFFSQSLTFNGSIYLPQTLLTTPVGTQSVVGIDSNGKLFVYTGSVTGVTGATGSQGIQGLTGATGSVGIATTPLILTGTTLSILQSTSTQSGYLSTTDWNTFNNKVSGSVGAAGRVFIGTNATTGAGSTQLTYTTTNANLNNTLSINSYIQNNTINTNTGGSAGALHQASNGTDSISIRQLGTNWTTNGLLVAKLGWLTSSFDMLVNANGTNLIFAVGSATTASNEVGRFTSTSLSLSSTTNLNLSGNTASTLAYHDSSKNIKSATLGSNLTLTGGVLDSGTFSNYSAISTIVGWSSFTEKIIYIESYPLFDDISFSLSGTSNDTATSFTIPNNLGASAPIPTTLIYGVNNGSTAQTSVVTLAQGTNIVNINQNFSTTTWTASGTKTVRGNFRVWK